MPALAALAGQPGPEDETSAASPKAEPVPARLATPDGFEDEAAFIKATEASVADALARAEDEGDTGARADALLKAANLVLAYELEPACSAKLLGLDETVTEQAPVIMQACERADAALARVAKILDDDGVDMKNEGWAELNHRYNRLGAFAAGLRAFLSAEQDDGKRTARRAASRLSILLEDRDPRVAAAAALWQAALRADEEDPGPALSILDRPLATLRPETMRYTFFARVLRCQLTANRGGHVAGLALLTQMEELCHEWFAGKQARGDAVRAVTLVEIEILESWRAKLTGEDSKAERSWCEQKVSHLQNERFAELGTLTRLGEAIPLLVVSEDQDEDSANEGG